MFLQRAGITPVVYEGRQEPNDEAGAFLNLAPNGVAVLDTLGIKEPVLGCVTPTTGNVLHNHRGRRLGALPETTTLLRRGLLFKALREVAVEREIPIEFGKLLEGVEITAANAAIACFEDGTEAEGDLLVGCNGRHSRTRRSAMPDTPEPRYPGSIDSCGSYRSASVPPSRGVMRITFGKEGFFGYQVAPSAEVYWFENSRQPVQPEREERQAIPDEQWRRKLLDVHPDDHAPIAEIIRFHDGPIRRWPSYDMPSLPSWHTGPVCLIGDAAHATLPSVGQGASLAMKDAVGLARCRRVVPDREADIAAFDRLRKGRVEKLVEEARRNRDRKAPNNALTRGLRDLVLPFFLEMGIENARKAYSYTVDRDEKGA